MNNMNIKLEKVRLEDRNKLERLLQLYLHDLSLYFPITFNSDICQYEYNLDKYFIDNYAYFIKNDKDILGFVLIDDNKNNDYEISEIFVLNNYKRNKIGKEVVIKVFDMYKGNWTIKAVPNSKVAESFWKSVVKDYTNNNYIEKYTGKYNRLEIYFSNGDFMIRTANEEDAARIVRIHLNSWRSTYNNIFPKEVFDKQESEYNTRVENIKKAIRNGTSNYVLLEEEKIVKAFICYGDVRGDKYKECKEIYSIYIESNNQKKGYGTKLIKYCFNIFKKDGYKRVIIRCLKENTANEFYQKMGGKVVELESSNVHGIDITECVYEFILGDKYL